MQRASTVGKMDGRSLLESFRSVIPPETFSSYKGQSGRIAVVGGSTEYTGAPYFAAMSAMRAGADLSHVFCPHAASTVIKSYSPDLIVHPLITNDSIESVPQIASWFSRMHAVLIGPGLGRGKECLETAKGLIWSAVMQQKPLIIDADGLFLLSQEPELVKGYEKAILTPNYVELQRLHKAVLKEEISNVEPIENVVSRLALKLGHVTLVLKGEHDVISNGRDGVFKCDQTGSPRRCGGQGDLLSGVMTVFLYWAYKNRAVVPPSLALGKGANIAPLLASYSACHLIKVCSQRTYEKHKRSMVASDILGELPNTFAEVFDKD